MIPLSRPSLPKLKSLEGKLRDIFQSGMITNAKYVNQFEEKTAKFLGVEGAVAVSHGSSGLLLVFKCLNLKGEVILPSFTFSSEGHSLLWLGLKPVFVDIDPETFNINPDLIEEKITDQTSAIVATHVFGNPCEIDKIEEIAEKHNLKVIYDAAHSFGSKYKGKSVAQFGHASVISFTPTKTLTAAEGGLIIVKDNNLVEVLKSGRDNGDNSDKDKEFLGITARMPEFNAILGIENLKTYLKMLKRRLKLVELYKKELKDIPGISFQKINPDGFSDYKDMAILIDKDKFGISKDQLIEELKKREIMAKSYFSPPLHKKKVYQEFENIDLPVTEIVSNTIVSLPLYSHMDFEQVKQVCSVIKKLSRN